MSLSVAVWLGAVWHDPVGYGQVGLGGAWCGLVRYGITFE